MNKFILPENIKHILTEKYLLDERFVLNEASSSLNVDLENSLNTLSKKLLNGDYVKLDDWLKQKGTRSTNKPNVNLQNTEKNVETHYKEHNLDALKNAVKQYLVTFLSAVDKDPNEAVNKLKKYTGINQSYSQLRDIVTDNDTAADATANNDTELNNLKTIFDKFKTAVDTAKVLPNAQLAQQAEGEQQAVKNFNDWVSNVSSRISETRKLVKTTSPDNISDDVAKQLIAELNKIDSATMTKLIDLNNNKATIANLNKISAIDLKPWDALLQAIRQKAKEEEDRKGAEDELDNAASKITTNTTDWYKALSAAKTDAGMQKVWNQYYKEYWGDYEKQAKALGASFVRLLMNKKLGFEPSTNPFLGYIKYCFDHNFNLNASTFYVIYDMYNKNFTVNNEMLRRTDKLSKVGCNLLYCADFYNQNVTDMSLLLTIQKYVLDQYMKGQPFKIISPLFLIVPFTNKVLIDSFGENIGAFCKSLFIDPYSPLKNRAADASNFSTSKLKDARVINQEYAACFGAAVSIEEKGKTITNTDIKRLVANKTTTEVKKLLYYFASAYQKDTTANLFAMVNPYIDGTPAPNALEIGGFASALRPFNVSIMKNPAGTLKELLQAAKEANIPGFDTVK